MKSAAGFLLAPIVTAGILAGILAGAVLLIARAARAYESPPASTSVTIAGKKISIDYYAPSAHGRKIMDGLVPFGEVWCTGANYATQINTEADLQVGDLKLPKGSYSIWTVPNEKEWTLIINKETGQSHLDYDSSMDFGHTKMGVKMLKAPVEKFRIELRAGKDAKDSKGTLALIWENTEASVSLEVLP